MSGYIRPGFLITRVANPIMRRLGRTPALMVRGRRTGQLLTIPMAEPLDLDGRRYLVSGRGETHWVRNLRAASTAAFRLHGSAMPFHPVEVTGAARDTIVGAYRGRLGHSVDRYFREIPDASGHPVFRMDPLPEREPAIPA